MIGNPSLMSPRLLTVDSDFSGSTTATATLTAVQDEIVDNNFDYFQFSYGFIVKGSQNCNNFMMELISPIIKKIKTKNFYRIKANLLTKTKKIEKQ